MEYGDGVFQVGFTLSGYAGYDAFGSIQEIFDEILAALHSLEDIKISPEVSEPAPPAPGDPIHVPPGLFPAAPTEGDDAGSVRIPVHPGDISLWASAVFSVVIDAVTPHVRGIAHRVGMFVFSYVSDEGIKALRRAWHGPPGSMRIETERGISGYEGHMWTRNNKGGMPNLPRWDPNEALWNQKPTNASLGEVHPYINPDQVRI